MRHDQHSLVVLSNRLPFDGGDGSEVLSSGGLVSALAPILRSRRGVWIGQTKSPLTAPAIDGVAVRALDIDPDEFRRHCEGFCASTLWPLYHDMVVPAEFDRTWRDAYRSVNARFAQAADDAAGFGATVWIHDYHLQLVPEMLRSQRPDVRIGFFNHLPFPPKELFAQLPTRTAIAEGMLHADVIGFQLDSDVQNFRSCALAFSDIDADRSETVVDSFPMSIDAPAIHDCADSPKTALQARELRTQFGAPETLLLGIDRLEHTKGILQRLLAYEELLEEGALDPRSTTLVQIAVPSEDEPPTQTALRDEAEQLVGRINGRFGTLETTVIHYCHRSYSFESLIALYLAADVLLATSLRDGMNLIAKEYVAARRGRAGVLVLSEFAGSAGELTQALSVNPHDADALKHQMSEAVHMPAEAARRHMDAMASVVDSNDGHQWAERFLHAVESV